MPRRRSRCEPDRLARVALAIGLVLLAVAGCDQAPRGQAATGIVIAVDGSLAEVSGFTLRTVDGIVIELEVDQLSLAGGGKPAPHLREHMASGEPIVVEYRRQDERNIATRYYDVP